MPIFASTLPFSISTHLNDTGQSGLHCNSLAFLQLYTFIYLSLICKKSLLDTCCQVPRHVDCGLVAARTFMSGGYNRICHHGATTGCTYRNPSFWRGKCLLSVWQRSIWGCIQQILLKKELKFARLKSSFSCIRGPWGGLGWSGQSEWSWWSGS